MLHWMINTTSLVKKRCIYFNMISFLYRFSYAGVVIFCEEVYTYYRSETYTIFSCVHILFKLVYTACHQRYMYECYKRSIYCPFKEKYGFIKQQHGKWDAYFSFGTGLYKNLHRNKHVRSTMQLLLHLREDIYATKINC